MSVFLLVNGIVFNRIKITLFHELKERKYFKEITDFKSQCKTLYRNKTFEEF